MCLLKCVRYFLLLNHDGQMKQVFLRVLPVCSVLLTTAVVQAEDAYLQMLEGEASDLELDQSSQLHSDDIGQKIRKKRLTGKRFFSSIMVVDADALPRGLSHEEFEVMLEQNFFGTYVFYEKLKSTDKRTVYFRYSKAETTDLETVRKDIVDLIKR